MEEGGEIIKIRSIENPKFVWTQMIYNLDYKYWYDDFPFCIQESYKIIALESTFSYDIRMIDNSNIDHNNN